MLQEHVSLAKRNPLADSQFQGSDMAGVRRNRGMAHCQGTGLVPETDILSSFGLLASIVQIFQCARANKPQKLPAMVWERRCGPSVV